MDEQKTGQRICPGCGKKIPVELHFCLYCMTRLTPVEDIDKKHAGLRKKKWICLVSVLLLTGVVSMLIGSAVVHRSGRQETLVAKATEQVKNTEKNKHLVTKNMEHLMTEAQIPTEALQQKQTETETEQKKGLEERETETAVSRQAENTLQTPEDSQSLDTPAADTVVAQTNAGTDAAGAQQVNTQKAKAGTEKKDAGTTDTTPEEKKVLLEINWDTVAESVRVSLQQKYESLQVLSSLSDYQSESYTKVGQTTTQALGKDRFCQVYPADSDAEDPNERDTAADWMAYYEASIVNTFSAVLDQNPPPADENRLPAVAVYLDHYEDVSDGRTVYFTLCY